MKKINYTNITHYILIGAILISIFLFFTPLLSFEMESSSTSIVYGLTGISLLVNNGKAVLIKGENIVATLENLFPKSNIVISIFALSYVALIVELVNLWTRKSYKLDKYLNPLVGVICLINLILICCVSGSYKVDNFDIVMGYGSYIIIVFIIIAILASIALSIYPLLDKKNRQD